MVNARADEVKQSIKIANKLGANTTRLKNYLQLLKLEQSWQRKLKLAETKLKKYRRRLKRYEHKSSSKDDPSSD